MAQLLPYRTRHLGRSECCDTLLRIGLVTTFVTLPSRRRSTDARERRLSAYAAPGVL